MRDKLMRRAVGGDQAALPPDHALVIHHGHDTTHAYLKADPPTANGVLRFTLREYEDMLATMQKVAVSLKESIAKEATDQATRRAR